MNNEPAIISTWIYNLADYCQIFDLKEEEFQLKILDYPSGIASFNAEMHRLGHNVVSADTLYKKTVPELQEFAKVFCEGQINLLHALKNSLQKTDQQNLRSIEKKWRLSKKIFLEDYSAEKHRSRYRSVEGLELPFDDHEFKLALCSDFMFHSESLQQLSSGQRLQELCRVAEEVRIFPLLDENGNISESLGPVMLAMQDNNFGIEVREVPYTKIKGGNAMLRIWATECVVG